MYLKARKIEAQKFVMTNLRNGIDYLKATCKNAGDGDRILFSYKMHCPNRSNTNKKELREFRSFTVCPNLSTLTKSS